MAFFLIPLEVNGVFAVCIVYLQFDYFYFLRFQFLFFLIIPKFYIFSITEKGAVIHTVPFKCCVIPNFISDEDILSRLETELLALKFLEKSNDLYKFHQVNYAINHILNF